MCPFCPKDLTSVMNFTRSQYLRHIRDHHSADPFFSITCGFDGCPRTFKSFSYFRIHVYECHGRQENPPADAVHDNEGGEAREPLQDDNCWDEHGM